MKYHEYDSGVPLFKLQQVLNPPEVEHKSMPAGWHKTGTALDFEGELNYLRWIEDRVAILDWLNEKFPAKTEILKGLTSFDERHFREERRQLIDIISRYLEDRRRLGQLEEIRGLPQR
jgi:hypothetical protein